MLSPVRRGLMNCSCLCWILRMAVKDFKVSNYWLWSNGFLLRPSLTDRLQYSSGEGYYNPIYIEYVVNA